MAPEALIPSIIALTALFGVAAVATAFGKARWERGTLKLRSSLDAARLPGELRVVDLQQLKVLPAPVQRYFRVALSDGQPVLAGVRMRHHGTINMGRKSGQWKAFSSDQKVVARRPGFDWDARISVLPGLIVRVHDAYVAGEGRLHAALLGLITVADMRGTDEIAQGELMRFLAEAAWYPTALLPTQGVQWEAVDARSARATLADGSTSVTLLFIFNEQGLIDTIHADARPRAIADQIIQTPWQGRFWNYQQRDGMLVPLEAEVAWLPPEGAQPYWRGRITDIAYQFVD